MKKPKCGVCCKVVHDKCKAIRCESDCDLWYHIGCVGVSDAQYDELANSSEQWLCNKCSLIESNNLLRSEINNLNKVITLIRDDCSELRVQNADATRQINCLNELCILKEEEIVALKQELHLLKNTAYGNPYNTKASSCSIGFPSLGLSNRFGSLAQLEHGKEEHFVASKFKASLVKFDAAYPYGPKQEEYEKVCEASSNIDDLLVVEISVKDYGEKENSDLAKKYHVEKDDFPSVKLFVQGEESPLNFGKVESFTAENLKKFVRSKSGVYIGCTGCIQAYDELAAKFIREKTAEGRKNLLLKAETLWDKAKGNQDQKSAEVYVKVMRKVLEKGQDFLNHENTRVENLLNGKITKDKRDELQHRINVLQAFKSPTHDEL